MIKLFNWFRNRSKVNVKSDAIVEGEFLWCIVGNIVDEHFYGENKEVKRGTKHFRPGAKVYCIPEFGGMGHESIRVIGKPRGNSAMINIVIPTKRIKNFRLQKVYSNSLFDRISEQSIYRVNNTYRLSIKELNDTLTVIKAYTRN